MKMDTIPQLFDVHPENRTGVFIDKLNYCKGILDFSNPRAQFQQKETKRRHLVDLTEYIAADKHILNSRTYKPFIDMIAANILRTLPCNALTDPVAQADDDEPCYEPAWPHLQLVYGMLRSFVVDNETDSSVLRDVITVPFVTGVVELFNSEDPNEREYLKTILHRMYGKAMPMRAPIREAIMDIFHRAVYENSRCHGLCELLEILGSIIHGFAVPLKEEHKVLLRQGLIPLHSPTAMPGYHVQLSFCVAQFVEKEPTLGPEVLFALLRHWPVRYSRKEVLLLAEMEEIFELSDDLEDRELVIMLFRRLGRCIESPHFQVAERALFYWNNEFVLRALAEYRSELLPSVVGPLLNNTTTHWNRNVALLSSSVLTSARQLDGALFDKCISRHERESEEELKRSEMRMLRWRKVYRLAQLRAKQRRACKSDSDGHVEDCESMEADTSDELGGVEGGMDGVLVDSVHEAVRADALAVVQNGMKRDLVSRVSGVIEDINA